MRIFKVVAYIGWFPFRKKYVIYDDVSTDSVIAKSKVYWVLREETGKRVRIKSIKLCSRRR